MKVYVIYEHDFDDHGHPYVRFHTATTSEKLAKKWIELHCDKDDPYKPVPDDVLVECIDSEDTTEETLAEYAAKQKYAYCVIFDKNCTVTSISRKSITNRNIDQITLLSENAFRSTVSHMQVMVPDNGQWDPSDHTDVVEEAKKIRANFIKKQFNI